MKINILIHLIYAIYKVQNILHAGIACVYFAFNSMTNYWKDEDKRGKYNIKCKNNSNKIMFMSLFSYCLDELSNDVWKTRPIRILERSF